MFLISKFPINEDYLRELIDPAFDERYQIDEKTGKQKGLGAAIFELQNGLETKFKEKYVKDDYQLRKKYFERYKKKNGDQA